jgi:prepilin-type N-terminal cleavage/methylation domain-containing protein
MRVHNRAPARPAFTLVELLVAMTIIVALAALAAVIFPKMSDSSRVASGADKVQGILFLAKERALRDQLPRGVRLTVGPDGLVHSLELIEQPQPYTTGTLMGNANSTTAVFSSPVDFFGGVGPGNPAGSNAAQWAVQPGDYLDPNDGGVSLHRITGVTGSSNPNVGDTLTLASQMNLNQQKFPEPYRIVRAPRPMLGEKPVDLPKGIVVDSPLSGGHPAKLGNPPQQYGSVVPVDSQTNQVDILFAPSGKVLRTAGNSGKVILWVYDASGNPTPDQTLVVVYTRTGAIAAHPVNVNPAVGDPYQFVRDGKSSGM